MKHTLLRLSLTVIATATLAACGAPQERHVAADATAVLARQQAPQVQRATVAKGLYELVYSPRQQALFVASSGGFGPEAGPSRILRLDPQTLAVQAETVLERRGFGLALDDAAGRLYVGHTTDGAVSVIDTATGQVTGTITLAEKIDGTGPDGKAQQRYPHNFRELVLDTEHHRLYAPGLWFEDSALYVVNTQTLQVEKVLPGFGFVATGVALDSAAGRLYVSNFQGQLFTVDTGTLQIQRKQEVGGDQLVNLRFDAGHGRVLATDQGVAAIDDMRRKLGGLADYARRGDGGQVLAIDPASGETVAAVSTGEGPLALLLDAPRKLLYVTNREAGTVTVHDADDYRLLHTVELPTHPNSLSLDEQSGAVFVTVKNGERDPKGSDESVVRLSW